MASNFIVCITGRGVHYCGFASGMEKDLLVESCQTPVDSGFEVYIYSIENSPAGQPPFFPHGVVNLRRHFHLYNAEDEYTDTAESIVNKLSVHSAVAAKRYIKLIMDKLNQEDSRLSDDLARLNPTQPTEPPATGS